MVFIIYLIWEISEFSCFVAADVRRRTLRENRNHPPPYVGGCEVVWFYGFHRSINHHGAEADFAGGGVMAQGFGPKTVAMAILRFALETNLPCRADLLLDRAQVRAEFRIGIDAQRAVFEGAAQGERQFFFH